MDSIRSVIVTGGAGFIGSHFVDSLMKAGLEVLVIDDFSSGRRENLRLWEGNANFSLLKLNLREASTFDGVRVGADLIIHMAANPEVRAAEADPQGYVNQQLAVTRNALELSRLRNIPVFVLASSSTVYGDAKILPTPENYAPLNPISVYGRMKLLCEQQLSQASAETGLRGLILRFANMVGPRGRHGVIYDLLRKLQINPRSLEVLGDGRQRKSYLHVQDCVEASVLGLRSHLASTQRMRILNIGNGDWLEVRRVAEIVTVVAGLRDVKFIYKPGAEDGRGWKGDVREMLLDIGQLTQLGWKPRYSSEEAVQLAAKALISDIRAASA